MHGGLKLRQLFYDLEFETFYATGLVGHSDELQAKTVVGIPGRVMLIQRDVHCGGVGH